MLAAGRSPSSDASTALAKALERGYRWRQQLMNSEARSIADIAKNKAVMVRYISRLVRLNSLAPDIIERMRLPAASHSSRFSTPSPMTGMRSSDCSDPGQPTHSLKAVFRQIGKGFARCIGAATGALTIAKAHHACGRQRARLGQCRNGRQ